MVSGAKGDDRAWSDGSKLALEGVQAGANLQNTQVLASGQSMLGQLSTATPVGSRAGRGTESDVDPVRSRPGTGRSHQSQQGHVTARGSRKWFRSSDVKLEPGDMIVVPTDAERTMPLPLWSAVLSVIFNLAVAVAAVNSF